jgi:hypothetical protein
MISGRFRMKSFEWYGTILSATEHKYGTVTRYSNVTNYRYLGKFDYSFQLHNCSEYRQPKSYTDRPNTKNCEVIKVGAEAVL